jgi:hypothetical protein
LENNINTELLPRLREMGIAIPEDLYFEIKNDGEKEEARRREDASNKMTADIALVMKNAGLKMDAAYFEERTGIPTETIEAPTPTNFSAKVQNKLKQFYGK